jgi:hypothetical protein
METGGLDRASVHAEISRLARDGDPEALRSFADSLPSTEAYAYERHRARAFALALTGAADAALTTLNLAAAAEPPAAGMLAEDAAQLHVLLGNVPRALAALQLAVRSNLPLGAPAELLAQSMRVSPAHWRLAVAVGAAAGPRSLAAVAGVGLATLSDRAPFRVGVALLGLATVVVALLGLPALLNKPERGRPGVTAPSAAAGPPHDVVVVTPSPPATRRERVVRTTPRPVTERATGLISVAAAPPRSAPRTATPATPRAPQPAPAPPAASPPPAVPQPAPAPAPPPQASLATAPAAASAAPPAPSASAPGSKHGGRALALGQKRQPGEHPPPPPPKEPASPPAAAATAPTQQPAAEPKDHGNGKGPKP